jgi:CarD family transcriptional regulator
MEEKIMNLKAIKINDLLVMPRWGVGKCQGWQTIEIDGGKEEVLSIYFYTKKVTTYFPKSKIDGIAARGLASLDEISECFEILKSKKSTSRQNWMATSKNYYQKINSGEVKKLAEVIRDTCSSINGKQKNQSKIEIHNLAVDLFAYELMFIQNISYEQARDSLIRCKV